MKRSRSSSEQNDGKKKGGFSGLLRGYKTSKLKLKSGDLATKNTKSVAPRPVLGGVDQESEKSRAPEVRPKTVWTFWHEGEENLPPFYAMCVKSWRVRLGCTTAASVDFETSSAAVTIGTDTTTSTGEVWDVRVLNLVQGHVDNALNFVGSEALPNRFFSIRLAQHQADLVRLALLEAFGGVWCDCGCLLLEGLDGLWNQIAAPSTGALPNQTEVAPHQTNGTSTTSTQANTQGRNGSGGRSSGWGGGCGGVSGGGDSQGSGGCKAEISVSASLTSSTSSSSSSSSGGSGSGGGGGKLAHFFLRSWGDSAWDDKDFVEVWFLAVGSPYHPVIAEWRAAFLEYWQDREAATGCAHDPFFASVGLGETSKVPGWGHDYLAMAHTYKKLLVEDELCRHEWEDNTILLDAEGPYFPRLVLGARNLQALADGRSSATAARDFRRTVSRTPMLKFNGTFLGDLKSLTEEAALGASSASAPSASASASLVSPASPHEGRGGGGDWPSSSSSSSEIENSTLEGLLRHALRPQTPSGTQLGDGSASRAVPTMTWKAFLASAQRPQLMKREPEGR